MWGGEEKITPIHPEKSPLAAMVVMAATGSRQGKRGGIRTTPLLPGIYSPVALAAADFLWVKGDSRRCLLKIVKSLENNKPLSLSGRLTPFR